MKKNKKENQRKLCIYPPEPLKQNNQIQDSNDRSETRNKVNKKRPDNVFF